MVEIKRNINRTVSFSYDGITLPYAFVKIEKVAENSNYYCLWITEEKFHLFNIKTKEYALKINTNRESKTFCKIVYYSNSTRSFVAYRSDKEYVYLLFEDGEYENYAFKSIGKEINGIRAVKGHNNKWMYYNVHKKRFTFDINKGLLLCDDEELVPLFNLKYYTIYKVDLYYKLIFFDIKKHKIYHSDKIEYFEDTENNRVIGKLFNRNIYALFKNTNLITPIGYFNSKPRYVDVRNIFIAKKLNSYVIIDGNREISNSQWTEDYFIFHNDYVLNRSARGIWKLYSFNDGKEICTNWINIRYDSKNFCIIADTDKQKDRIITENDINDLSNLLLEKSKKVLVPLQQYEKDKRKIECSVTESPKQGKERQKEEYTNQYNNLPQCVDYISFVQYIQISNNGYIQSSRTRKMLSFNNHICWVIQDKHAIAISRYIKTKAHKVIYYKENICSEIFNVQFELTGFIKTNKNNINEMNDLLIEVAKNMIVKEKEHTQFNDIKTCNIDNKEGLFENKRGNSNMVVTKPKHYDEKMINGEIIDVKDEITFYFDRTPYVMKRGDIWDKSSVFWRRQFINKGDLIVILLDDSSKVFIENNATFYEIKGEGKDCRFNQDFNPTNRAIRDNNKRILLFQSKNGSISLLDEVFCVGYDIRTDEKCEKNVGRKIIVFKLRSLSNQVFHEDNNAGKTEDISQELKPIDKKDCINNKIEENITQIECSSSIEINDCLTTDAINEENMKGNDIDVFAHLRKLYLTMSNLKELGLKINDDIVNEINRLEEKLIKEDLLPSITSKITDVLSPIEQEITLVINYIPNQPIKFGICRDHLTETVIKANLLEVKCEDDEQIKERTLHTKTARSNLRITLPNGKVIVHSTAVESLIEFINYVGVEKAQRVGLIRCKIPLISQHIDKKYGDRQKLIGNGLYLMTCTSTEAKKKDIENIASFYNMKVRVEII